MIDLSANPEAVLTLENGSFVTVNKIEFKFERSEHENEDGTRNVFLTTTDSRVDEFNANLSAGTPGLYENFIEHLRAPSGQAAMLPYELAELIRTNTYEIH